MENNDLISILQLQVLAQAIEDILRFEVGLPLVGSKTVEEAEEIYFDAYEFLQLYPSILYRISRRADKKRWLEELDNARYAKSLRQEGKRLALSSPKRGLRS